MNKTIYSYSVSSFLALQACLWSSGAYATDAFNLIGYGPVSLGMGGSGAAYDIGAQGMMLNPATLTLIRKGAHLGLGIDIISADLEVSNTLTGEKARSHSRGRNNGPYFGPELSYVWRGERFSLGVGAFASDGVGTQFGDSSFLSRTSTNGIDTGLDSFSRLLVLRVPLSAAYQVNEKLAVGASLDAVWTSVNLGLLLDTSQIGSLAAQGRLSGSLVPTLMSVPELSAGYLSVDNGRAAGGGVDAWGIGGRLGLTYQLSPQTRFGLAYNFKTNVGDVSGDANLTAVSALAGNIPLDGSVTLRNFEMPAHLVAGLSHWFADDFVVSIDYKRVYWSDVMKDIRVGFKQQDSGDSLSLILPFNYRDTNVFSVGAQYRYSTNWAFRAGIHYADQATPSTGVLPIIPSTPTTNVTGGVSYAFGANDRIDFALAYGFREKVANDSLPLTDTPIEVAHSQIAASFAYTKAF
ncbi:OmpP1/FadL family transporter [Marinobacter pelagius]|uniref:Long-chain fatty acid transport protein n=1 Tax=Marinobacter pelagius TaxID=379482 RepID=A0A1I4XES7_9GAMM|nr:outer membrane protein transport protein [Marinobacter pelagius]SFN24275.1 long-chain fatty acid transport protein [Marinobacter pelagius]